MRWRTRVAVVIFGLGLLCWIDPLARLEGRYMGPEGVFGAEGIEKLLRNGGIRDRLPSRGTIGYRDERAVPRPFFHLCLQYSLAPLVLDTREKHEVTLVVGEGWLAVQGEGKRP